MKASRARLILISVLVCLFAVGMAGLLNFFKYRSNAERLVKDRLGVTGQSIENSIQSSLSLGLNFSEIGTLPGTMERERAGDDLILSIDVFNTDGKLLYSTDRLRLTRPVPARWIEAAQQAPGSDWSVKDGTESAAANVIKNNFGLTIGHVALRYSDDQLKATTNVVAGELALSALVVFIVAAALASVALLAVMRGLSRQVESVETALRTGDVLALPESVRKGPFGDPLQRYFERMRTAEAEIALLRGGLAQGEKR